MAHGAPDDSNVVKHGLVQRLDDLGELAVRLGSVVTYNRSGTVLLIDGFGAGINAWKINTYGDDGLVVLTGDRAYAGGACVLMNSGTGATPLAQMVRFIPVRSPSHMGLQVFFSPDNDLYGMNIGMISDRKPTAYSYQIFYKHSTGELRYYRDGSGWTTFASMGVQYEDAADWHNIKMVIDTEAGEYVRCYFDDKVYDMGGLLPYLQDWDRGPMQYVQVLCWGEALVAGISYIDNVVVTTDEF